MKKQILVIILLAMFVMSCLALTACHEHEFGQWTVVSKATCTDAGLKERICECGEKQTEVIPATGHTAGDWITDVDSSCIQTGVKHQVCATCGAILELHSIAATGHNFGAWTVVKESTCTQQGQEQRTCACGEVETRILDLAEHVYSSVVTEPTCTTQGYTTHTCACGNSYVDTPVDELGHTDGEWITDIAPSCTHDGSKHQVCATCNEIIAIESIQATGHNYGNWTVAQPATCTEQGLELRFCQCGASQSQVINALGHDEVKHNAQAPTCTQIGWNEYVSCSRCDYSTYQQIPATAHIFENWTVVNHATCTQNGLELGFCECSATQTRAIPATGHTDGDWITDLEPTCTAPGSRHQVCAVCNETLKTESIDATGHSYVETVIDATCTSQGYTLHTCSVCGDSYKDNYIETNGEHNFQEADTCAYCGQNIADVAVETYNMSATADDNVRGYVVARADGKYDAYIKGNGAMDDYSSDNAPFYIDEYKVVNAYIEYGVTHIGDYAFYYIPGDGFRVLSCLINVEIPNSVISIGNRSFESCHGLTSIIIPSSVTIIGASAFEYCSSLTDIIIEGSPQIGAGAFEGTVYYKDVNNWQDKVLYIGNCLIEAKTTIEECTIKQGTTVIANGAFGNCSSLTSIMIPSSVIIIGSHAFSGCTRLPSITVPDSVISIGEYTFAGCSSLESMVIPFVGAKAGVTSSDTHQYPFGYIFGAHSYTGGISITQCYYDSSTSIATSSTYCIPASLKSVSVTGGNILCGAFYNCANLISITIPAGGTSIGKLAFAYCHSLASITIPESVQSIGESAFAYCVSLSSITIPSSVTSFGSSVFAGCSSLTNIIIPDGVTSIGKDMFYYCTSLTSINIPNSVTDIGEYAFAGCSSLINIAVPDDVTSIGLGAFYECNNLISVTISKSVVNICDSAFYGCSSLTTVYYSGTEEQWNSIAIGIVNTDLTNATITFNYTGQEN